MTTTLSPSQAQAASRLALKLRLERRLTEDFVRFARGYLESWANAETFGGGVAQSTWALRGAELLARHYVRVIRTIEDGRYVYEGGERLEDVSDADTAARLNGQAIKEGQRIVDRIAADLTAVEAARQSAPDMARKDEARDLEFKRQAKKPWSVVVISSMRQAWAKLKTRIPTWSNVNTQDLAEAAAKPRLTIVDDDDPNAEQIVKQWLTMRDEKVREAHAAAEGQTVPVDQPFEIGGHLLRHPGDGGLGAPLDLLINCRCIASYGVMRDGEFVPFDVTTAQGEARAMRRPGEPIGFRQPKTPTQAFTFGFGRGPWRGNIVLGSGSRATYTVRDGGVTIRVGSRAVASAPIRRDAFGKWTLGEVNALPDQDAGAIDRLLRASVEASNRL